MTPNSINLALTDTSAANRGLHLRALRVALIYALAGATWILLSDRFVEYLFDEVTASHVAQSVKGTVFVLITATLIYWLALRNLRGAEHDLLATQLADTRGLLEAISDNLGDAIFISDGRNRKIEYCNAAATEMFGYSADEMLGKASEILHVDRESFEQFGRDCARALNMEGVFRCQYKLRRQSGKAFDAEITVSNVNDQLGWRAGVVVIVHDISDRVQTYEALRKSEQTYRLLAENTLDVIWSMDPDLKITYVNPAIKKLTGYTPDEVIGSSIDVHFDEHHLPALKQTIEQEIAKGPRTTGIMVNSEALRKDGSRVPVEINGRVLFDTTGKVIGLQGSTRDISERLRYEAQLRQSQKMEAIGILAAGIAHEVNNPIASISGFAELIGRSASVPDTFRRFAGNIQQESGRVSEIVENLLGYARIEDEQAPSPVFLPEVVDSTLMLVQAVLRHDNISLEVSVNDDLSPIAGRRQQIQQVLMNLLTNARDALNAKYPGADDNKRLLLSASVQRHDSQHWVRITIEDHGPGIPQELQERVFDPFYTTKPPGKGTGLGLWLVYSIVENHHGHVRLESEPGEYTRFHVEFPAIDVQAAGATIH